MAAAGAAAALGGSLDEDLSVKRMRKRYEGLLLVRSKAIKGKGAWYWSHLEPILVHNPETGTPKAVKLRCGLCNAMFSASNPSRTASEHLKRGTCPNFSGALASSRPPAPPLPSKPSGRKRASSSSTASQQQQQQQLALLAPSSSGAAAAAEERLPLLLSGGKEDLGALALLEDNVKRIKSPAAKPGSSSHDGPSKEESDAALNLLAEWLYESYGTVSLSCVEHPKFKAFLNHLGLPAVSRKFIAGERLDARYHEVKQQSEARLRDALFFQLCGDGWKRRASPSSPSSSSSSSSSAAEGELVYITLNLPNGSSLFCRAVPLSASASSPKAVEAILEEAIMSVCDGSPERCVGIVADTNKFAAKALQELELRRPWMVNVPCQAQAFTSLLKDLSKRYPLFGSVASECLKLVDFFRSNAPARSLLQRFQREAYGRVKAFTEPELAGPLITMVLPEDVAQSARALHSTVADGSFKMMYADDPQGREVMELVGAQGFWSDLEAVQSLIKLVRGMIREMEVDRPLVSQCIPLWNELRSKVMGWCARYGKDESGLERVIQQRFARNYHPAWSAALVLDPLYLVKDSNNRYLPPYKSLSPEQEKDVDRLITRLVSREEAHIVLMELMKWRSEGLEPLYAQAVQVTETEPLTGRIKYMSAQSRRLVWETCLNDFKLLGKVAARLIFLHATSCGLKSWSTKAWAGGASSSSSSSSSRAAMGRAAKMMYIAAHAKLERHDFVTDEERGDAHLLLSGDDEDDKQQQAIPQEEAYLAHL